MNAWALNYTHVLNVCKGSFLIRPPTAGAALTGPGHRLRATSRRAQLK